MMKTKILKAIQSNKLNPEILGERKWYNYYINVTELVWSRNNHDGYKIELYSDETKISHLGTIVI